MDGVEGFHAAYSRGRIVSPPTEYLDMIVVPAVLHIDPLRFSDYPPAVQAFIRQHVMSWIAGGQGMDTAVVAADRNG